MPSTSLTPIIEKALDFAIKYHKHDLRKGTSIPYIVHLLNVQSILAKVGAEDEIIAAGLLHDIVEDTPVTIQDIKSSFGPRISGIVSACTEKYKLEKTGFDAHKSWKERKEHTIYEVIPYASSEQLMVILADKLDNIRSIERDHLNLKDKLWTRFNAGKYEQSWYYKSITEAVKNNVEAFKDEKIKNLLSEIRNSYENIFTGLNHDDLVKIFIANDHQLIRTGLKNALERLDNFKVVQQSSSFQETIDFLKGSNTNLLLLDDVMPGGDLFVALEQIKENHPDLKIIITSMYSGDAPHFKRLLPLVNGLISYGASGNQYIEAVETVYLGGLFYYIPGFNNQRKNYNKS